MTAITTTTITTMATPDMGDTGFDQLFDLVSWTSPAWPIGAFAFSSGMEWACEAGHLPDRAATAEWIETMLAQGSAWNDAVLFVHAHRAVEAGDAKALETVVELGGACATSAERRLESLAQGAAFLRIAEATLGPGCTAALAVFDRNEIPYPVAFATLAAARAIPLGPALAAFLHAVVANLVSAAQRLVPLGQTDGQNVCHRLRPAIAEAVGRGLALPATDPADQIGSATLLAEFASIAHETQYTRLFRT